MADLKETQVDLHKLVMAHYKGVPSNSTMNKIKVALIFEDKSMAKNFVAENAPYGIVRIDSQLQFVYETSILRFDWIKPFINFKGKRVNFVFTTKDIRDSIWFDTVIRPMQMVGTGVVVDG